MTSGLGLHIHHDRLFEFCYSLEEREEYVRTYKPPKEVATRVRLMRIVDPSELPTELRAPYSLVADALGRTQAAYERSEATDGLPWAALKDTWDARDQAWDAYDQFLAEHKLEFEALHARICPNCPWDGHTIFPEEEKQ